MQATHVFSSASTQRVVATLTCAVLLTLASAASAGPREQARRMHDRLAGVPPSASVLDAMETEINAGRATEAAFDAMDNAAFYNVTLKNFVTPWTNRDRTVFAPLNDYTATVIGMVRDDVPFNTLLSANLVYVGKSGLGLPAYSMSNNDLYETMESRGIDLKTGLVSAQQSAVSNIPAAATAGIFTTRGAASAFFIAGTNRAMFRFTMLNHLCHDMEAVKDITRPPDRIRQDVTRSPGGDSRIFLNNCIGCHSGMDPMAQAFAYYNYDQTLMSLVYAPNQVQDKYHINTDNFKYGYSTPDDHWTNYWRQGQNALLGWSSTLPGAGTGAKSMGEELESSAAFAECQVTKVFQNVCFRAPVDGNDRAQIDTMVASFKASNYHLKEVFAESAVYCMGD
jgi:hypothetical protein